MFITSVFALDLYYMAKTVKTETRQMSDENS